MTDEEWVDLHGADDDIWYSRMERDFRHGHPAEG
jgi:hypothetical protein